MTDEQIVEALKYCSKGETICFMCPLYNKTYHCVDMLAENALDIINRQQADNERLKRLLAEADTSYNKCAKRFYKEGIKDFAESLCKDRVSNDPVVIAVKIELKEWLGETE